MFVNFEVDRWEKKKGEEEEGRRAKKKEEKTKKMTEKTTEKKTEKKTEKTTEKKTEKKTVHIYCTHIFKRSNKCTNKNSVQQGGSVWVWLLLVLSITIFW